MIGASKDPATAAMGPAPAPAKNEKRASPKVLAIADVESNAQALIQHVLTPAGIRSWTERSQGSAPDVVVVDVTQLRGDPLGPLRTYREKGNDAPAIVLAAHIPANRMRDLLRLGVRDLLLKPYRPAELVQAIYELSESRSSESTTQVLGERLEVLRERIRHYDEEISVLGDIGRAVGTLGDLDLILKRVAEAAAYVTNAEETNVYLVEPGTSELSLRAIKQASERHAALHRLRVTDELVAQVFRTGKPLLHQPSPEGTPVKVQTGFLVQSMAMVPLRLRERVVGVLGVYNPLASTPFDEHHLTLLVALADWGSVALEHAALLQQVQNPPPAPPEPEAPAAPLHTGQVIAAPPALHEGLDRAITALDPLLTGSVGPLTSTQTERLRNLQTDLRRLAALPIATLDAALAAELVDLPGVAQQVVEILQIEASRKGLKLSAESYPPLPLFPGDENRTSQVLEGLTTAAIRRTNKGRVMLKTYRIAISSGLSESRVPLPANVHLSDGIWEAVSIVDTSSGLSPDTQRALNSALTDPEAGKTGPGLSMGEIRMIAESLGASIWHEQTHAGAAITFAIPVA